MRLLTTSLVICSLLIGCSRQETGGTRRYMNLNADWKFIRDTTAENLFEPGIDDSGWETVALPHTTRIESLIVNEQWQGTAWYRKHITIDRQILHKKLFIRFGAAMQVADIWLNGKKLSNHVGGYLPFIIDITDHAREGDNVLTVLLNNEDNRQIPPGKPLDSLDFNMYGGLYRNVDLIITDRIYITDPLITENAASGVFISADSIIGSGAFITIKAEVKNESGNDEKIQIRNILLDVDGNMIATTRDFSCMLKSAADSNIIQTIVLDSPNLWHPHHPYLYILRTIVTKGRSTLDAVETSIGIRKAELKPDGFYLNGEKFFINGTNRHQEYPYIGYALSDEAQYRDAIKIKNAGFDFIRCSHYPQSEAFLDACDELGLLVMDCIPGWQFMGDETFKINALNDCRNMIRRDRNHPSVVFWEVSLNETPMDSSFMNEANSILDEELSKDALSAGWVDYKAYDVFIPARQHGRPPDYWNRYRVGEKAVFIAEYGDWEYFAQDAGFNQSAFKNLKPEERTSRQLRRTGEKGMLQQALNYQEAVNSNMKGQSTIGQANWLMFDYNRGYADDIEASGISDIFRLPKFAYYFYQSQRTPEALRINGVTSGPMVYIASYWQPGSSSDVKMFSNCEEVALYLNDKLVERKKHDQDEFSTHLKYPPFTFHLHEYTKGTLKAIGYIGGKEVTSHVVVTPEDPVRLELTCDLSNKAISCTGKDMIFIYAAVLDSNGTVCPLNDIRIEFAVEGNAALIGSNPMMTEAGIASILLETQGMHDNIIVTAKASGLISARLELE